MFTMQICLFALDYGLKVLKEENYGRKKLNLQESNIIYRNYLLRLNDIFLQPAFHKRWIDLIPLQDKEGLIKLPEYRNNSMAENS